jgi:hypothetical protein
LAEESNDNSRSLRDDNKRSKGNRKATADPYGMTTRKARATATTTADPYGMTTRKQGQPQRQQQIPSEMTARKARTTAKASPTYRPSSSQAQLAGR